MEQKRPFLKNSEKFSLQIRYIQVFLIHNFELNGQIY